MPRPTGTPFWGERIATMDGAVLAGTVPLTGTVGGGIKNYIQTRNDDNYATMDVGDEIVAIMAAYSGTSLGGGLFLATGTYLVTGDPEPEYSYVIRCRGTATIAMKEDQNVNWDYTEPANTFGTQSISSASWTEIVLPTTSPTVGSIMAWDGQRLSITVTSGSLEIDQVALQAWPVGGPLGGYVTVPSAMEETPTDASSFGSHDSKAGTSHLTTTDGSDTWVNAVADLAANLPLDAGSTGGTATINWIRHDEVFLSSPIEWDTTLTAGAAVQVYTAGVSNISPSGTNGVDYIRRPDRVQFDADAFAVLASDGVSVPRSYPTWITPRVFLHNDPFFTGGWWTELDSYIEVRLIGGSTTFVGTNQPAAWDTTDGTVVATVAPTDGDGLEYALDIGTLETFSVRLIGSLVRNAPTYTHNAEVHLMQEVAAYVQTSDDYAFGDPKPLQFYRTDPAYKIWSPDGSPEPEVSWVRNVQRNDGLGVSPWRWGSNTKVNVRVVGITFSGFGSNQSIRWRGTR